MPLTNKSYAQIDREAEEWDLACDQRDARALRDYFLGGDVMLMEMSPPLTAPANANAAAGASPKPWNGVRNSELQSLANQFNVSKKLILLVTQRKIWKHVA